LVLGVVEHTRYAPRRVLATRHVRGDLLQSQSVACHGPQGFKETHDETCGAGRVCLSQLLCADPPSPSLASSPRVTCASHQLPQWRVEKRPRGDCLAGQAGETKQHDSAMDEGTAGGKGWGPHRGIANWNASPVRRVASSLHTRHRKTHHVLPLFPQPRGTRCPSAPLRAPRPTIKRACACRGGAKKPRPSLPPRFPSPHP
jgi:hypothetical protein